MTRRSIGGMVSSMMGPARRGGSVGALLLVAVLWPSGLQAAPDPHAPEAPAEQSALDRGHDQIDLQLERFIDAIDRFFGDDNYEGMTSDSFLRVAPGVRIREGPSYGFKLRLRANLELPRTKRRLGLILAGRGQDEDPLDGVDDDDDFAAGLRAALFDDPATKLRLSVGSRFRPEPKPFVRLRFQRLRVYHVLAIRPSVTAFWELDDGLGQRSRLDLDLRLGPRSLVRQRSEVTYGESTKGVEFRTSLSHFFALRERSAWKLELRMDVHTRPTSRVVEYRGLLRYRWSMFRPWLFFEIEPAVRFRRQQDFAAAPEAIFRVELVFGSLRRLGPFDAGPHATLLGSTTSTPSSSRVSGPLRSLRP